MIRTRPLAPMLTTLAALAGWPLTALAQAGADAPTRSATGSFSWFWVVAIVAAVAVAFFAFSRGGRTQRQQSGRHDVVHRER
jgi:hypothetical protein